MSLASDIKRIGLEPITDKQRIYLGLSCKEQGYGGAKRGGKSVGLSKKIVGLSYFYPGNRGYLIRQDLTDLKESTLVTFEQMCPPELIYNHHRTDRRYDLRTMDPNVLSVMIYEGLEQGGKVGFEGQQSAKGKDCGWFAVDEPSEISEAAYLMYLAQLNWTLPQSKYFAKGTRPPYMAMWGSNPEPGWVHRRFKKLIDATSDAHPLAISEDGKMAFVRSLPKDNEFLPEGWEQELRNSGIPPIWIEKYLDGSWEISIGQVFKEFDRRTHCILEPVPAFLQCLKLYASIDHAPTGVTCMVIIGISPGGYAFVLDEYYQPNRLISEHSRAMKMMMDKWVRLTGKEDIAKKKAAQEPSSPIHWSWHGFEYILIDPSAKAKILQSREEMHSTQDEYYRNGVQTYPAVNTLEGGLNLLAEYIHPNPQLVHPFKDLYGSPRIFYVERNCPNCIRETIELKRDIDEHQNIKYRGSDHALDNIRYVLNSRPVPPVIPSAKPAGIDSVASRVLSSHRKWSNRFGSTGGNDNNWFNPERHR